MRSGNLKSKITLQKKEEVNDGGEITIIWVDVKTIYAQVIPKRGSQFYTSGEVYANMTHTISMRWFSGVTSKMRFKFGVRVFEIIAPPINVRELNKTLECLCKEWEGDVL